MLSDLFIKILLVVITLIGGAIVQQLFSISKTLNEIKTNFEVLNTKHDYLEDRVLRLEKYNFKNI